ncbi:MAG: NUDIX hydrolase [Candidatus Microgenomates bacterium]|jgi:8-oxo-dGTP pyrophosphatase MutT (NUDIX family)
MVIDQSWYVKPKNIPVRKTAGGVVIRKESGKLLIGLIRDSKYQDWMLPKGGVKKGENVEKAAKREVTEETGISQIKMISHLGKKERLSYAKDIWAITEYYLFVTEQVSGQQKLEKGEEDIVFQWFDLEQLPTMNWPEQKAVIKGNKEKIRRLILS